MGDDPVDDVKAKRFWQRGYWHNGRRASVARLATVALVFTIPTFVYVGVTTQQNHSHLHSHVLNDDWVAYDAQLAMCRRIQVVRDKQNFVIRELRRRESRFHDHRFSFVDEQGREILPTAPVNCKRVISPPTQPRPEREPSS